MRKLIAVATILTALGGISGARAEHCSDIYLFTRFTTAMVNPATGVYMGQPAVAPATLGCPQGSATAEETTAGPNLIQPGSNSFSLRWISPQPIVTAEVRLLLAGRPLAIHAFEPADFAGVDPTTPWELFRENGSYEDSMDADFSIVAKVCVRTGCVTETYETVG